MIPERIEVAGPGQINVFVKALSRHGLSQAQVALWWVISSLYWREPQEALNCLPVDTPKDFVNAAVMRLFIMLMGGL